MRRLQIETTVAVLGDGRRSAKRIMSKHFLVYIIVAIPFLCLLGCGPDPKVSAELDPENRSASPWNLKGRIAWRETASGGVVGILNPESNKPEWRITTSGRVAGVWNPVTKEAEWHVVTEGDACYSTQILT